MADTFRVQAQIRANAEEVQDSLKDLRQWEQQMSKKDADIKRRKAKIEQGQENQRPVVRSSGGVVNFRPGPSAPAPKGPVSSSTGRIRGRSSSSSKGGGTAADHTYDKGYKKWERFDVDAALADGGSDGEDDKVGYDDSGSQELPELDPAPAPASSSSTMVTPATITADASRIVIDKSKVARPRARTSTGINPEDAEREKGNDHYRKGEFTLAIKCYTRSIGYNSSSAVAFSNRAMAYLKTKEYTRAEADASVALSIDPHHVKSLQRRAAARTNLGMHRAALQDLQTAVSLESTRELVTELRRAQEMLRACIRRAPKTAIPIKIMSSVELPPPPPPPPAASCPSNPNPSTVDIEGEGDQCGGGGGEEPFPPMAPHAEAPSVLPETSSSQTGADPAVPSRRAVTSVPHQKAGVSCRGLTTGKTPPVPKAPKSSYELQRHWRSLGNDPRVRASYLQQIKPNTLPKLISNHMEPELLADLVVTLVDLPEEKGGSVVVEWLVSLQRVPRMDMTVMLLSQKDKDRISRALDELEESRQGTEGLASAITSMRAKLGGK